MKIYAYYSADSLNIELWKQVASLVHLGITHMIRDVIRNVQRKCHDITNHPAVDEIQSGSICSTIRRPQPACPNSAGCCGRGGADPAEDAIWNEIATGVVVETDHRRRANAPRRWARRSGESCAVCRPSASGRLDLEAGAIGPARTMRRTRTRPTLVIREGPARR
jgi:hypothetical protein